MGRPPTTTDSSHAAAVLADGGLVAFPTETVYGLGADAGSAKALARVFAVKGRPVDHPLIVHGADADALERFGRDVPPAARRLAGALWPGPLTLLVARADTIHPAAVGGRNTVGVRVPNHPVALAMLRAFGGPVAAPSANRFGRISPTSAADVVDDLGAAVNMVLDGGPCTVGVESTILDLTTPQPTLLRAGGVPLELLEDLLGAPVVQGERGPSRASGMLEAHYAPRARVELHTEDGAAEAARRHAQAGRWVCLLGRVPPPPGVEALVPDAGPEGYARTLYRLLREADALGADVIVAVPPEPVGLGRAVADRLARAAAASR